MDLNLAQAGVEANEGMQHAMVMERQGARRAVAQNGAEARRIVGSKDSINTSMLLVGLVQASRNTTQSPGREVTQPLDVLDASLERQHVASHFSGHSTTICPSVSPCFNIDYASSSSRSHP